MVRVSSRGRSARALAVFALLSAAACSDDAVSPTGGRPAAAPGVVLGLADGAVLHTGRYRDTSKPNATGRSGSALLTAQALLDAHGVTHLLVSAAGIEDPETVDGELVHVQIKAWGPDGEALFTNNYHRPTKEGWYEFLLMGVPAGSTFQVQANVRGIDRNRTDVVVATGTVNRDADLETDITPPPDVVTGVPTVITTIVTETNGDVGTDARCVLYVDGVAVDSANVWVDAGDAVTCAFTHIFPDPGEHGVEVVITRDGEIVATDGTTVNVEDPNPTPRWRATAADRTVTSLWRYDLHWTKPDGSHKEYEETTGESWRGQTIAVTGTLARATVFPLATVSLALGSDAAGTFQTESWSGLTAAADVAGQSCVNQLVPDQGGHFTLCSTGVGLQGSTTFGYTRFAGRVTFHSAGFSRTWDAVSSAETYWTWNTNSEYHWDGGQHRQLGARVDVQLAIGDGFGNFDVEASVPLARFDNVLSDVPYTCRDESPYWLDGGVQTICEGRSEREHGWRGEVSG